MSTAAERRLGEVIKPLPKAKGTQGQGRPRKGGFLKNPPNGPKSLRDYGIDKNLADLGISKTQSSRAAKQRRWRRRQAAGVAVYRVPLDHAVLNKLITIGLLGENESAVAHEVVKAVLDLVNDYFRARGL